MTILLSQTDITGHSRVPPSPSPQILPEKNRRTRKETKERQRKSTFLGRAPLPGAKEIILHTRVSLRTVRTAGVALVSSNIALTDGAHSLSHSHSL